MEPGKPTVDGNAHIRHDSAVTIGSALQTAGIPSLDSEVLLSHLLQRDRTWVLAHVDDALTQVSEWTAMIERARGGEPVAYIIGEKEFFGRIFHVDRRVLIPRPATERLTEKVIELMYARTIETGILEIDSGIVCAWNLWKDLPADHAIVDVGTGSGCIAVTLACELPTLSIIATDISDDALCVAKDNALRNGVSTRIEWKCGDSLDPLQEYARPFFIVSNPPYIRAGAEVERGVQDFEPYSALFGGVDGSECLSRIVEQARRHPYCYGFIMECESEQGINLPDVRPI